MEPDEHVWSWTDGSICYLGRMKHRSIKVAFTIALVVGGGFGTITSLINDISSPYGMIGGQIADTGWSWILGAAEVVSRLVGVGWAWAALAVVMGYFAGRRGSSVWAAAAAILTLLAATTAYYGMDSIFREESLAGYWWEISFWWLASVATGLVFGVVGAGIGRPGVIGLLCGLVIPVGASAWVVWEASGMPYVSPEMHWARAIVWVCSVMVAGIFIARFIAHLRLNSYTSTREK
jgi:hypothetical protein